MLTVDSILHKGLKAFWLSGGIDCSGIQAMPSPSMARGD